MSGESKEEEHAKGAIDVAGIFLMVGPSNSCNKKFYHFAIGSERTRLASRMKSMVVTTSAATIEVGTSRSVCALDSTVK